MLYAFRKVRCVLKVGRIFTNSCQRNKCHLVISSSHSIYDNLALEDWLYEKSNLDLGDKTLLLWRSNPCVVIGKFQNQWEECNHSVMAAQALPLARRKSGGGAVYHDLGNINLSFITHRDDHSREDNLHYVCETLMSQWPHLDLTVNSRHDILLDKTYKVSGTAAKMTRSKAYHHFTLLVNSNSKILSTCLNSPIKDLITSNASRSIPSAVAMLNSQDHPLSAEQVMHQLSDDYLSRCSSQHGNAQMTLVSEEGISDKEYPGIEEIRAELASWQWIYGKTPNFTLSLTTADTATICMLVRKGIICDITLQPSQQMDTHDITVGHNQGLSDSVGHIQGASVNAVQSLVGLPFCPITVPFTISQNKNLSSDLLCKEIIKLFKKIQTGV